MNNILTFVIVKNGNRISNQRSIRLYWDNWDDWGYKTQFTAKYFDGETEHFLGDVKIAFSDEYKKKLGIIEGNGTTLSNYNDYIPITFKNLDNDFFSLGSIVYYENIRDHFSEEEREYIFKSLNDLAYDLELFFSFKSKNISVLEKSLLRDFYDKDVTGQLHRIAHGGVSKTPFHIQNTFDGSYIEFRVKPESFPSTNVHAIIGSNGVGKSYLLKKLYDENSPSMELNKLKILKRIYISFSPFENDSLISLDSDSSFIGFSSKKLFCIGGEEGRLNSPTSHLEDFWAREFSNELFSCKNSEEKKKRWKRLAEYLHSDPIFYDLDIINLIDRLNLTLINSNIGFCIELKNENKFKENCINFFNKLSSGHKIILYTMASLCNQVIERTLVLYDEPELFLHPPLLSSFVNAINWLMDDRNGIAILATHSPIILQEIPSNCIWKVIEREEGKYIRLYDETYGESFSILNNVIFDVQVKNSGFYKVINDLIKDNINSIKTLPNLSDRFDYICNKFETNLGSEAKILVLTALKSMFSHEKD